MIGKISLLGGLTCLLLVGTVSPLAFTSCDMRLPEISITLESDYSGLVAAINQMDKSLSEKLSLIETTLSGGLADNAEALKLIRQAIASLGGTLEEKLAAIESAVKSQETSLSTKLAAIEAAVLEGFANQQAQQALLLAAIESLDGTLDEKMTKVEEVLKGQTTSVESKLGLIEASVKAGLADARKAQELLKETIEALGATLEEKLTAIDTVIAKQTVNLSAKLALIETAVKVEVAEREKQQGMIEAAIASLQGSLEENLAAIAEALGSQTTSLETKLSAIEAAVSGGFADGNAERALLRRAVESLGGKLDENLATIESAIRSQTTSLDTKLGLIEAALKGETVSGDSELGLIKAAIESLQGSLEEKLDAIELAVTSPTSGIGTKLAAIETALKEGLAEETKYVELIQRAVTTMGGTVKEQLASLDTAMTRQTTSLNTKLEAITAAVTLTVEGEEPQFALIKTAIESLQGSLEEKLGAVEEAIGSQTTKLEAKLGAIEAAVKAGLADSKTADGLIQAAIESLGTTLEAKLGAIDTVIMNGTADLSAKLLLIEAAVKAGITSEETALGNIKTAVETMEGSLGLKIASLDTAMTSLTTGLGTKLSAVEAAIKNGFVDEVKALDEIKTAISSLLGGLTDIGTDITSLSDQAGSIVTAVDSMAASLSSGEIATALTNIFNAVKGLKDYSEILTAIQEAISGIELICNGSSDKAPFELIFAGDPTSAITVTTGSAFTVPFRVNPSSVTLTMEMLQLNCTSDQEFFLVPTKTVTAPSHFTLTALEKDSSVEGQWNVTITSALSDEVWDEAVLTLVSPYKDSKGETQYLSTQPFKAVMIPSPSVALDTWAYPYASFCAVDSFYNAAGGLYADDTLGVVYYALDKMTFATSDGAESRSYSADNIVSATFEPTGGSAPVKCILDSEKHFVRFYPDTTGSTKWSDFRNASGIKREDVAGNLTLTDKWGATFTTGVDMAWFNTYDLELEFNAGADEGSSVGEDYYLTYNLTDSFKALGLDDASLKDCRYSFVYSQIPLTEAGAVYEEMTLNWKGTNREVDLVLNTHGDVPTAGQKYRVRGKIRLQMQPAENDLSFKPTQLLLTYCITLNILETF